MNWLKPTHITYCSIKYMHKNELNNFSFTFACKFSFTLWRESCERREKNAATNLSVENVVNSISLLSQHNSVEVYVSYTHLHGMTLRCINMIFQVNWREQLEDLVICNIVAVDLETLIWKKRRNKTSIKKKKSRSLYITIKM